MAEKTGIEELRVEDILKERGIKMKELAGQIGITPESLTRALQRNPQFSTLKKIAEYLDVPMRDLFKCDENVTQPNKEMQGCIFYNNEIFTFNTRKELEDFIKQN